MVAVSKYLRYQKLSHPLLLLPLLTIRRLVKKSSGTDERRVNDSDKNSTGMTPEAIRTAVLEALSDPVVIRGVLSAVQAAGNAASPDTGLGTNSSGVVADGESSNMCSN